MVDIRMIVPGGILCLWSAWSVYNLTTQIPNAYYIAIERTRKIVLPDYPEFQLVYQSDNLLSIGATRKMYKDTIFLSLIWNVLYAMQSNTETKSALM